MRLEVVNGLVGFCGKPSEFENADKAIVELNNFMNIEINCGFDNGDDEVMDLSYVYDTEEYTVKQVKEIWIENKKEILKRLL